MYSEILKKPIYYISELNTKNVYSIDSTLMKLSEINPSEILTFGKYSYANDFCNVLNINNHKTFIVKSEYI